MSIPGIPGASNPTFRTRDCVFVSLDQLIVELCEDMSGQGLSVAPFVAKTIVQLARRKLEVQEADSGMTELAESVFQELKTHRILFPAQRVAQVLTTYGRIYASFQIEDVTDQEATG